MDCPVSADLNNVELISTFRQRVVSYFSLHDQIVELVNPVILAWYRERDDRSLFVDKAVCAAQLTRNNNYTHAMGLFARNPNLNGSKEWRPYLVLDGNFTWLELLTKPPTLEQPYVTYRQSFTKLPQTGWYRYDSLSHGTSPTSI